MKFSTRKVGRWKFRDNHYVFRRAIEKWLVKVGAKELKDHKIRHLWEIETEADTTYVIIPFCYEDLYIAIVKFENPFKAVQIDCSVDYKKKEIIFTYPYVETGIPYMAAAKFINQFKKFLK